MLVIPAYIIKGICDKYFRVDQGFTNSRGSLYILSYEVAILIVYKNIGTFDVPFF